MTPMFKITQSTSIFDKITLKEKINKDKILTLVKQSPEFFDDIEWVDKSTGFKSNYKKNLTNLLKRKIKNITLSITYKRKELRLNRNRRPIRFVFSHKKDI